jgi:pilus assembly protein CpaC
MSGLGRRIVAAGVAWCSIAWLHSTEHGCLAQPLSAEAPAEVVQVPVGVHRNLSFAARILRIAIGDPKILSAKVIGADQLLLLGRAPGATSLIVWTQENDSGKKYDVVVPVGAAELGAAFKRDPELVDVTVEPDGIGVVLGGYVPTTQAYGRAIDLARHHAGQNVLDRITVVQQQVVSVEVKFAALSVTTLKKLGFDFRYLGTGLQLAILGPNSGASFSFVPNSGLTVSSGLPVGDAFNLLYAAPKADFVALLGAISGTRLAKVLAEPTLLVRSGESADFLAGGEIPIPIQGGNNTIGIEYRKFGIQLRLAATVLSPSRIVLRISPEVSDLDFSRAVTIAGTVVPAFSSRSATTTLELGHGESFVLAGLISSTLADNNEKVPYLGDLPILGNFFRRVNDTRERQELIMVVSPRLVSPLRAATPMELPGAQVDSFRPTIGDMLLNRNTVEDHLARHGLLP